jgi:predicted alpha/beta-fold hydrolase
MLDSPRRSGGTKEARPVDAGAGWRPFEWLLPHVWTVAPRLRHSLWRLEPPPGEPWQAVVEDPVLGPVSLSGRLHRCPPATRLAARARWGASGGSVPATTAATARAAGAGGLPAAAAEAVGAAEGGGGDDELVVLLHGMGGSIDSYYMPRGALAAAAAGMSSLRLNLRGADLSGEDFYHAGLTADVHAALASPALRRYRRIYLLGHSMGGHLALRFASEPGDPRVVAVAAVCSPLDLRRSQQAIDGPGGWPYRRYLLSNLARIYATVAARRKLPLPAAYVARLRKMRDFDDWVVAPRHGFDGAEDYYARASVAPQLGRLRVPALLVNSASDPMVLAHAVRPVIERRAPRLAVRWVAGGGHVGFPEGIDLGLAPDLGVDGGGDAGGAGGAGGDHRAQGAAAAATAPRVVDQVLAWLRRAPGWSPVA